MRVKGKRVLKNGVTAGYVRQEDGSWKWRFLSGPKKSRKRGGILSNEDARNKEQVIRNFIETTNNGLEDIFDPNQIQLIINIIKRRLMSDIPSLTTYAFSKGNTIGGNAEVLANQLRKLLKKAEKRMNLLENRHETNSEQEQLGQMLPMISNQLHKSPKGRNWALSFFPTAVSGRKHTMPNLDDDLSINQLKKLLEYLKENPSIFKSKNNTERKMINNNIISLISKKYLYYYTKFITNPKLQRLLQSQGFLRTSGSDLESKNIINEMEEKGGNALFYIKQVDDPKLYSFILKYFINKIRETDMDPYYLGQFTNSQGNLPNLRSTDAYTEIIITKNNSNRNANAMPNWMQNKNQQLESGAEIYRMRVEGRFFAQLMNNLIIPMLRFQNQTNIDYLDENGIAVVLVPNIFGSSTEKIGDFSFEGLDVIEKALRARELTDIINNLFVTLINNYLRDHNIVIDTNIPHNANNGQGGAARGGSRKRRKRKSTKKKIFAII